MELIVKGGIYLVDHILEGLRLIKDGTFLHESLCVVEEFGFIRPSILLYGAVKIKVTDVFVIEFLN